jgi:hypothetical protein
MDSIASLKVMIMEGKRVAVHSLACNISGVEGHVRAPGWGLRRLINKSITYIDLHKLNNKLVSA